MRRVLQNVCSLFDTSVFIDVICVNMCEWGADDLFCHPHNSLQGFLSVAEQLPNQTLMQCVRMLSVVLLQNVVKI